MIDPSRVREHAGLRGGPAEYLATRLFVYGLRELGARGSEPWGDNAIALVPALTTGTPATDME